MPELRMKDSATAYRNWPAPGQTPGSNTIKRRRKRSRKAFSILDGEQLLSEEACKLIEELANVDGHSIPLVTDGAGELFKD